jgi:cytochrome P450
MGITDDIADKLAQEAIAAAEKLGDDNLIAEVGRLIGAGSVTTQEAFMTAVRVRIAEKRARRFLQDQLAKGPKDPTRGPIELGSKPILDAPDEGAGH